ncbi:hypothetical protein [Lignipirellula cremea]|uniref:Uncharacterized protein n=1 Tax=Lignipirellula cremea TaxID=2528010 RepID=A0A518DTM0_9BACT|nr:hypothetical protein [Lignipirellula cremea]QDU95185.1 hypothetical protein Pla8534_29970 [Lignipirellula cremea]
MTHPIDRRSCRCCHRELSLDQFRRRRRDSNVRLSDCRSCHNRAERVRRAAARQDRTHARLNAFFRRAQGASREQIQQIVGAMLEQFGGHQGLADAWVNYHSQARGLAKFRCYEVLFRLMQFLDQSSPKVCEMSDDELLHELQNFERRKQASH